MSVGVLVKAAREILEIPVESIQRPELASFQKIHFFTGIATLPDRMIMVLDPKLIVQSLEGLKEVKAAMESETGNTQ